MHPIAPDREDVGEAVKIRPDLVDLPIGAKIGRIGFADAYDGAVQDVTQLDQSDLRELPCGEVQEAFVRLTPQGIALAAEVFEPQPDPARIAHHVRAPVVEDLQPAELYVGLLHVDPIVGRHAVCGAAAMAARHAADQQAGRHEVPIGKSTCNPRDAGVLRLQELGQLFDWHRRNQEIARHAARVARRIAHVDSGHAPAVAL